MCHYITMTVLSVQQTSEEIFKRLDDHLDPLEEKHAPNACNTLGLLAVKGDLVRSVVITHAEQWLENEMPNANKYVAEELQETRVRITNIDASKRLEVGSKIIQKKVPQFLLNSLGVRYDRQIFERLVEQGHDGLYAVSDDVLLNFLQWHSYSMVMLRGEFMEKQWPQLKFSHKYQLKEAVNDGWLPKCVLQPERLNALEQAELILDDGMFLHEQGSMATVIYDKTSATEVYFPPYPFLGTVYHELSHVMVGVETPKTKSGGRFSGGSKTYGLYRLFDEKHVNAGKVLDEAVTEHIARTMDEFPQNPDVIDPDTRRDLYSSYTTERKLLDSLCNWGVKPVDIRLFTRAYFEDSTRLRRPAIRKLKRELAKAFPGRDILRELGEMMSQGEYEEDSKNLGNFF